VGAVPWGQVVGAPDFSTITYVDTQISGLVSGNGTILNGLAGPVTLAGIGGTTVSITGQTIYINSSGNGTVTGYLTSGEATTLFYPLSANPNGYLNSLSGTGVLVNAFYPLSSGLALVTNLSTTGATLNSLVSTLSGYSNATFATIANLSTTGSSLSSLVSSLSGYSNSTFATVVNLSSTGASLVGSVGALSGYSNATFATISNLSASGSYLLGQINQINSISGQFTGQFYPYTGNPSSFATQGALAATGGALQSQVNSINAISGVSITGGSGIVVARGTGNNFSVGITGYVRSGETGVLQPSGAYITGGSGRGSISFVSVTNGILVLSGSGGGGGSTTSQTNSYAVKTSNFNVAATDYFIVCSGNITGTAPTAVGIAGQSFLFKNVSTGVVVITGTSSQNFDDGLSFLLSGEKNAVRSIFSNGANWYIF